MPRAITSWLLCRRSPRAPAGCIYFTGEIRLWRGEDQLISCPTVSLFRDEARLFPNEELARVLASALQDTSPSASDDDWRALPAEICLPSPYQPQPRTRAERDAWGETREARASAGAQP